jgi:hypothetical protein
MANEASTSFPAPMPPPVSPIPVAVDYFQSDASAVLVKLVHAIGVLLIVLGAIDVVFYPLSMLAGASLFRRSFGIPYVDRTGALVNPVFQPLPRPFPTSAPIFRRSPYIAS